MRLGGYFRANSLAELEPLCEQLDRYGLSAIHAPAGLAELSDEGCAAFGERARSLGLIVGEVGAGVNLMTADPEAQTARVAKVRQTLIKAEIMGCRSTIVLVGSRHPSDHFLAPHPYMYTEECKAEYRGILLRILDGLDLAATRLAIEPWPNTFFYQPEEIRAFIDSVGHPALALQLDQMNMVSHRDFFGTTGLIDRTFDLLADRVASVHLKDLRWDHGHMFLKWDEVDIGDGVMDYDTYLKRLARLPAETPCYCEHMATEADYALNFARLHQLVRRSGTRFEART